MTVVPTDVSFVSSGTTCAAWHVEASTDTLTTARGRPVVVMAHGFGGTRDTALLGFAEAFARAGLDTFIFDYRGFGASDGRPRQLVSVARQRRDFHSAVDAVRRIRGIDPGRVGLWGTSYSAGHSVVVAAQSPWVKAVVSLTPAADGLATLGLIAGSEGVGHLARLTVLGLADLGRELRDKPPRMVPIVGQPGSDSIITTSGSEQAYLAAAGPTWRNETPARHALQVAMNRPTSHARKVRCPVLVQIGKADRVVPVKAARRMAAKIPQSVIKEYPFDHFDVYDGPWHERIVADQIAFLTRVLR